MFKLLPFLALPLVPIAFFQAAAGSGHTVGETQQDKVRCEIRTREVSGGVRLEAVAMADRPLAGEYRFTVAKQGTAGTSQSAQSGDFALEPGDEVVLGEVGLGIGDDATYSTELTLLWQGGETSCTAAYPGRA